MTSCASTSTVCFKPYPTSRIPRLDLDVRAGLGTLEGGVDASVHIVAAHAVLCSRVLETSQEDAKGAAALTQMGSRPSAIEAMKSSIIG